VRFRFGEPLDAKVDDRIAHQKCVDFISATQKEWRAEESR
jgi:hypothetical protein